ncbi:MAG: cation transporter [Bacteroidota bacterium]|nr:cation transporter [Bacteroidota bacterium]
MNRSNLKMTLLPGLFIIIISSVLITGCSKKETANNNEDNKQSKQKTEQIENLTINLPTMQNETCKRNIESAVKKLNGIENINVAVKDKLAHIDFDKSKIDITQIEDAITSAGYDANDKKADQGAYKKLIDSCKLPEDRK